MGKNVEKKEEKKMSTMEILNAICSETLLRHSNMTKEEYFESLGVKDNDKSEDEIVNVAIYNLLIEIMKTSVSLQAKVEGFDNLLEAYMKANNVKEEI